MKTNNRKLNLSLVSLTLMFHFGSSAALAADATYPLLIEGIGDPDCQIALEGARAAFQSKLGKIYDAGVEVRAKNKSLIVWPVSTEEIGVDEKYMQSKNGEGEAKRICVQKEAVNNTRVAVKQEPMNWQGDWFSTVVVKGEDASKAIKTLTECQLGDTRPANISVVGRGQWQRPWLFRNDKNQHVVAVDTDHPAEMMADWKIFGPDKNGKATCIGKIAFRPSGAFPAMIPKGSLREMQALTDKIIGSPKGNQGTLHANDRAKLDAHHAWCNAIYRPWAMEQPNNSRAQVDAYLKRWAKKKPAYKQQYDSLLAVYPKAQEQLTQYYVKNLKEPKDKAAARATKSLDLALRSCFVLPSG